MSKSKLIPALITTDNTKRGVFMGFVDANDISKEGKITEDIIVKDLRMAVYWSSDVKGVLGLAVTGPSKSCRISKAVPKAHVKGVTAICELTPEAVKAWEKEPWG